MFKYFIFNKPYGTLCQFTGEKNDSLLGQFYAFPKDVYAVGRLDKDSEGLLLLTNDNFLKTRILDPETKTSKSYHVQIDGELMPEEKLVLENGSITINHKGRKHKVKKAICSVLENYSIEDRDPPIRVRKNIPTQWIALTITEGKNRQVRKMTAAVNHPTLRLIRESIGGLSLEGLKTGEVKELTKDEFLAAMK